MTFLKTTTILIEGKEIIGFRHLKLTQNIDTHNELEVHFPMDIFDGPVPIEEHGSKSKNNLGKKLSVSIADDSKDTSNSELKFSGIITEASIVRGENSDIGNIVIYTAKSNDIISNDGPNFNSFEEKTLPDIVKYCCNDYGLKSNIDPNYTEKIQYKVQHNESAYNFLHRIAREYGEWFYYFEDTVYFGKPNSDVIPLTFNFDLIDFKTTLVPKSHSYSYVSNDYTEDTVTSYSGESKYKGSGDKWIQANKVGKGLFKNQKNLWFNANTADEKIRNAVKKRADSQLDAISINQVHVSGLSTNQNIAIAKMIEVDGEKYRITNVFHSISYNGGYTNQFEGIAGSSEVSPLTNIQDFPKTESQIAVIKNNADPDGLGRVKVQFAWQQKDDLTTPWIRLLVPHAGSDQGIQFFPEIDDQVLVDFEGGNAECPYVVGSLYHKNQKPSAGAKDNYIKTIKTKGGSVIEFNDEDGKECITIKDKKGNEIIVKGEDDSIKITAKKDIIIDAGGSLSLTSKGKMTFTAHGDLSQESKQNIKVKAGINHEVEATVKSSLKAAMIESKAQATSKLEGTMVDINGTGMTNVKGAIVNLN